MAKREAKIDNRQLPIVPPEDQRKDSGIYDKKNAAKMKAEMEEEHLKEEIKKRKEKKPTKKPSKEKEVEIPGPHLISFDTDMEIPEKVCVYKDRRGRIIIETECAYEGVSPVKRD